MDKIIDRRIRNRRRRQKNLTDLRKKKN